MNIGGDFGIKYQMKFLTIFLSLILLACNVLAQQKFNPMTGKHETTTPDSVLKYNYMKDEYKYVKPDSQIRLNPYSGEFDMAPKEYKQKYDYMNNKYETVHPDAKMQMNPYTGDFQYVNPGAKPEMNWSTGDFEYPQQ